jgi:hypothetical protein
MPAFSSVFSIIISFYRKNPQPLWRQLFLFFRFSYFSTQFSTFLHYFVCKKLVVSRETLNQALFIRGRLCYNETALTPERLFSDAQNAAYLMAGAVALHITSELEENIWEK